MPASALKHVLDAVKAIPLTKLQAIDLVKLPMREILTRALNETLAHALTLQHALNELERIEKEALKVEMEGTNP